MVTFDHYDSPVVTIFAFVWTPSHQDKGWPGRWPDTLWGKELNGELGCRRQLRHPRLRQISPARALCAGMQGYQIEERNRDQAALRPILYREHSSVVLARNPKRCRLSYWQSRRFRHPSNDNVENIDPFALIPTDICAQS